MLTLFLDTTLAKHAVVKITRDDQVLAQEEGEEPLPTIEKALAKARLKLTDIDEFNANPGPGSYTGIRVGLAVVNALNWSLGKSKKILDAKYQ